MINIEVRHHDDKPELDKKTGKVKVYIEEYTIDKTPTEEWLKHLQDELVNIGKKWKSIYSIKFYIKQ